jgi:RNA polymerase sigma-70 factor (ECF subfamily)
VATRQDEFERIAMPHTRSLLRVASRLTSDPASAEDLVQEAMLAAWRGFHQFQDGSNARAWLFRILMNVFYGQGRKNRPVTVSLGNSDFPGHPNSGDHLVAAAEVAVALENLSVEHRSVLLLGVVEGFTCQEMAGILAIPVGTVMSRLSRAREALRNRLTPNCEVKEAST